MIELIILGILVTLIMFIITYRLWYLFNYSRLNKGKFRWFKCHDCKKEEECMYSSESFHGTIYRCNECAFKK